MCHFDRPRVCLHIKDLCSSIKTIVSSISLTSLISSSTILSIRYGLNNHHSGYLMYLGYLYGCQKFQSEPSLSNFCFVPEMGHCVCRKINYFDNILMILIILKLLPYGNIVNGIYRVKNILQFDYICFCILILTTYDLKVGCHVTKRPLLGKSTLTARNVLQ